MWSGWTETLVAELGAATGRDLEGPLFEMLGYDPVTRQARVGGGLISTPMARLRDLTVTVLVDAGVPPETAEAAVAGAWHSPDPVTLARPLVDLVSLLGRLGAGGRRLAVATSDDRAPTLATLAALGVAGHLAAVVCADDPVASKPSGDPVLYCCRLLGIDPARTAVVGDSPADMAMGRAAGAGLVIGVRTGIGRDGDLAAADVILDSVADLARA
jgi:phosphoglycolate phosphatase